MAVDGVRELVQTAADSRWIILQRDLELWDTAAVAAGPFPAQLRLDDSKQLLTHEVIIGELSVHVDLADVARSIPMPPPDITVALASRRVIISYGLPFSDATEDSVIGLLGAGVLYATALAGMLVNAMTDEWTRHFSSHGFDAANGFGRDPRSLLQEPLVTPWPVD